jgi:leader peptidase (prepilin peptidase) / N-methyltransferase
MTLAAPIARRAALGYHGAPAMIQVHLATFTLACLLAAVTLVDLRTQRIPDWLNATLLATGLAATFFTGDKILAALVGAAAGYVAFALISLGYRLVRGREGLGLGDAKLLGAAGAWIGWIGLPFVVLIAAAAGLGYVAYERLRGREIDGGHILPFGPFLCAGVMIVWCVFVYS